MVSWLLGLALWDLWRIVDVVWRVARLSKPNVVTMRIFHAAANKSPALIISSRSRSRRGCIRVAGYVTRKLQFTMVVG